MSAPVLNVTAAELHNKDISSTERYSFVGVVLEVPDTNRIVSIYNKKTRTQEDVPVLTCLLADITGPVQIDFWRDSIQFVRNVISQHSSASSMLLFRITGFALYCRPPNQHRYLKTTNTLSGWDEHSGDGVLVLHG